MPNRGYANSSNRELRVKKQLEDEGWYAVRASGSHGIADVVAVRPVRGCTNPAHYQVRFIQIKTSQAIREPKIELEAVDSACGFINVETWFYPVKNEKYWESYRKRKIKEEKKIKKSILSHK